MTDLIQTDPLPKNESSSSQGFGQAVAVNGGHLAIGEYSGGGGRVHTYIRTNEAWTLDQVLPYDPAALFSSLSGFGYSLAFAGEDQLFVGAPWAGSPTSILALKGAVIQYRRLSGAWTKIGLVAPELAHDGDTLGFALAANEQTVAIGAHNADPSGWNSGACHVLAVQPGQSPHYEKTLVLGPPADFSLFGYSIGVCGERLACSGAGASHVYQRNGGAWDVVSAIPCFDAFIACDDTFMAALDRCSALSQGPPLARVGVFGLQGSTSAFLNIEEQAPSGGSSSMLARLWVSSAPPSSSYLLLASLSGTTPGFKVCGASIPLNFDALTSFCVDAPMSMLFPGGSGDLGPTSFASSHVVIPAGNPALAGLTLSIAGVSWSRAVPAVLHAVSNPISLSL